MFSLFASTRPAPATVLLKGDRAGGTTGSSLGGVRCMARTWVTAKASRPAASRGRPYLLSMTNSRKWSVDSGQWTVAEGHVVVSQKNGRQSLRVVRSQAEPGNERTFSDHCPLTTVHS